MKTPNILAINLGLRPQSPVKIFPVGLSYVLSSLKRAGIEFELYDIDMYRYSEEERRAKFAEEKWDIVLLGCIVTGYSIVKPILAEIRRENPEALIVVGNSVASSVPRTLLECTEADVAVIGEGDVTIVEVVKAWMENGSQAGVKGIWYKDKTGIHENPRRPVIKDINTIPHPEYDIFEAEKYIEAQKNLIGEPLPRAREDIMSFPVNTARGCINRCTFCYHNFLGTGYRYRSSETVVSEIKELQARYGINYVLLWDDLTFFSKKQIKGFLDLMEKEKIEANWIGAVRGNLFQTAEDVELLKRMKALGCMRMGFALESADAEILKAMNKNVSLEEFKNQKECFDKAGIPVGTSIVLGYPQETVETIAKTYGFLLDVGIYPSTGFLLPQPGTPVYEDAMACGHITNEEDFLLQMGDRQDLRINLTKMSDEEFTGTVLYWLKKLNRELKVGLDESRLIKTQFKRARKDGEEGYNMDH